VTEPTHAPATADPDHALIEGCRRGDGSAFDALVRRHEQRVHRLAVRMLHDADAALDAAQEAFVKAWRALPRFEGQARFSTWMTRIVINQCRNELRRRRTLKHGTPASLDVPAADGDEPVGASVPASGPEAWESASGRESARAVEAALARLDDEAREVIVLRDAEDLSYEEVAEILDVPVGTVRSRLHRARAELRRRVGPRVENGGTGVEDRGVPRRV
jgi:RNA polymerase sigma-70 factor (ECF subfamily)